MTPQVLRQKLKIYYFTTIFSIVFSIIGFSYNAWRLEQSEFNASARVAAFSMLSTLAEFEQVVFANHYDHDLQRGNPRVGWVKVILLNDLASLMSEEVIQTSMGLRDVWQHNWQLLPEQEIAFKAIESQIDELRHAIKGDIQQLE
ncbi:hypothetical protein [Thalassotalea fusca]